MPFDDTQGERFGFLSGYTCGKAHHQNAPANGVYVLSRNSAFLDRYAEIQAELQEKLV